MSQAGETARTFVWVLDLRTGEPVRMRRDRAPEDAETFASRAELVADAGLLWDYGQAGEYCGIGRANYRNYVSQGLAPLPDDPDANNPPNRRRPLTCKWRVVVWKANRPGMGVAWDDEILKLLRMTPPRRRAATP